MGQAAELRFGQFVRVLAYWEQLADPDGVEERAAADHAAQRVSLSQSIGARGSSTGASTP